MVAYAGSRGLYGLDGLQCEIPVHWYEHQLRHHQDHTDRQRPQPRPIRLAPMEAMFNNKLQDLYANQTRLKLVKRNGDMHIAGEIVSYDQYNKGVSADGLSSQVQLKMTVNIRFSNAKTNESWEKQFTATSQYDASQQLSAVQEQLVTEMVRDLTEQIFNATVANW